MKYVLLVTVGFFLMLSPAWGEEFSVYTEAGFQNALTTAQSNGEDDTIYVQENISVNSTTLTYSTDDGDNQHSLTIIGNGHTLDGNDSVRILFIKTDTGWDGGDLNGDVIIRNLVFTNGSTAGSGGGLYVWTREANVTVEDCIFSNNQATLEGGGAGVGTYSGTANLTNNTFSHNKATRKGGGACVETSSGTATLTNNTFGGNVAIDDGGGTYVHTDSGTASLTNNTFNNNVASNDGGGAYVYTYSGTASLTNNTFSNNTAQYNGGGVWVELYADTAVSYIYNNIISGNTANKGGNDGDDLYVQSDGNGNGIGATVLLYNNILGSASNFTGQSEDLYITNDDNYNYNHNISDDPELVAPQSGNLHIKASSPAIDAGICAELNSGAYARIAPYEDFEGDPRPGDGEFTGCDIGADEHTPFPWILFYPAFTHGNP